jgi:hypothetical protein
MTLVAAFRIEGTPVLIGDLLLTGKAPAGTSEPLAEPVPGRALPANYYPVNPGAAAQLPGQTGYRVGGTRRKAVIINSRLCVAWSGSDFGARSVLSRLTSVFKDKNASLATMTELFSQQDSLKGCLGIQLIGWLFDDTFHCFRWNSDWPTEIFEDNEQIEGSGTEVFQKLRTSDRKYVDSNLKDDNDLVQFKAAALIANCSASDVFTGLATSKLFGYFFEIIFWDGATFRYVNEITISFWRIMRRPNDDKTYTQFTPIVISYRSFDRFCIVQAYQTAAKNTFVDVVGDGTDDLSDVDPRKLGPLPMTSKLLCWFFHATFPDGTAAYGPCITDPNHKDVAWIELKDGKEHLMIHEGLKPFDDSLRPDETPNAWAARAAAGLRPRQELAPGKAGRYRRGNCPGRCNAPIEACCKADGLRFVLSDTMDCYRRSSRRW